MILCKLLNEQRSKSKSVRSPKALVEILLQTWEGMLQRYQFLDNSSPKAKLLFLRGIAIITQKYIAVLNQFITRRDSQLAFPNRGIALIILKEGIKDIAII